MREPGIARGVLGLEHVLIRSGFEPRTVEELAAEHHFPWEVLLDDVEVCVELAMMLVQPRRFWPARQLPRGKNTFASRPPRIEGGRWQRRIEHSTHTLRPASRP